MIYFLQATDGGPVKVGFTTQDVEDRVKQLESHYGKPLAVLATLPGDHDREREIHERFAHLRLGRTEQFQPARELMDFIDRPLLVDPNPETVEAIPSRHTGTLPAKIDAMLVGRAQMIAKSRGISLAEYISETLRPTVDRDFFKEMKKLEPEGGGK